MKTEEAFNVFLEELISTIQTKTIAVKHASWKLETTGSKEAAEQLALLATELKLLYSNEENYQEFLDWKNEGSITSSDLLRILNLMINKHKMALAPPSLLKEISNAEVEVAQAYVNFRGQFENKDVTENDLINILKTEKQVERRKKAWEATKKVGNYLAPLLLKLVKLRNQLAHRLGYADYYKMKLQHDEIDHDWLFKFLSHFDEASKESYSLLSKNIAEKLAKQFQTTTIAIGPWAWSDPFCQEDPLISPNLDDLLKNIDIVKASKHFFNSMGFEVDDILNKSDLFERKEKNQHAFCTNLDRNKDIRILTNIRPNLRWLETLIHELGHAVYEKGFDPTLHWYLRTPPHILTTEAVALMTGRHAYDPLFLKSIIQDEHIEQVAAEAVESQKRRQIIFSRWVLVMVHFEAALYANPEQDLNALWWSLVQKYQRICPPSLRGEQNDWACKCHFGISPVYYHSYLLGEFLASMFKEHFEKETGSPSMYGEKYCSQFLNDKLFFPGNRMPWNRLNINIFGKPLQFDSWIKEFCS